MLDDELAAVVASLREVGADGLDVEAKKAAGGLPSSLRETLSAFSNTAGGTIILGLDESESFAASGVSDPAKMASDLASMCAEEVHPPVRAVIKQHQFEGAWLIVAEVPEIEPSLKPCFSKGRGISTGSYIRVHDGDQHLSTYEVQTLIANRGQPLVDGDPVPGTDRSWLDDGLVAAYVERVRQLRGWAYRDLDEIGVLQQSRALAANADGDVVATLAGLLAMGRHPQQMFPQLTLTLVVYPTEHGPDDSTGTRFLDNVTLDGPVPVMARDALAAVTRNMRRRSIVSGVGRTDTWEYPEAALREAIVNALIHRDLSAHARGTQVQIEMYPDRLLIRNPGGLFGPVTVGSLTEEVATSSSRNSFLLRLLEDVSLPGENRTVCENRGSGIRTMVGALRSAGMSIPKFDDRVSSFTVTFPNHALLDEATVEWFDRLNESGLTDSQIVGLATMRNRGSIDNSTYRAASGLDSRVATAELRDLVSRELIVQIGTRRWTEYRLSPRTRGAAAETARRLAPRDRRQVILDALQGRVLSRAEIELETGLNKQVVIHWLRVLRKENQVQTVGNVSPQSKNVRYERVSSLWSQTQLDFGE